MEGNWKVLFAAHLKTPQKGLLVAIGGAATSKFRSSKVIESKITFVAVPIIHGVTPFTVIPFIISHADL